MKRTSGGKRAREACRFKFHVYVAQRLLILVVGENQSAR